MSDLPINTETELKLTVQPEHLARLRKAPVLAARGAGRPATQNLESIYYDTADGQLLQRLVTLRVRKKGDRYIQTVKTAGNGDGVLTREEWEWPVASTAPDLAAITEPEAQAQLGELSAEQLQPVFATQIKRTTRLIDDGAIEIAFDSGEIRAGDRVMPIVEVELELKRGQAAILFELALALNEIAPVRFEPLSKAARGYALAAGTLTGYAKAARLELAAATTVEDALILIVRNCLDHLLANEACAVKGEDAEGVHQMRVAIRRLRSALSVFRRFLPPGQYDWLVAEVRWLAGAMGPARDWDVFIAELLAPVRQALAGSAGIVADLDQLAAVADSERANGYQTAAVAIRSQRYTALLLRIVAWLEKRDWRQQAVSAESARLFQPVTTLADQLLAKRHRRARKTGTDLANLLPDQRHQLRISLKKLRYAVEFFRSLYEEKAVRRYLEDLTELQDALGHLNDVTTATRLLSNLHGGSLPAGEPRAAGVVIGWHGRGVVDLEPRLLADWEAFLAVKPFWSKPDKVG